MRTTLLGLCLFVIPLGVFGAVELGNDREGKTYYDSGSDKRDAERAVKLVDSTQILGAFQETLKETEASKVCSFDVYSSLQKKLKRINPKFNEMKGALIYLRTENELDDMVTKLLLTAHEVSTIDPKIPKAKTELPFLVKSSKPVAKALKVIAEFEKNSKGACFDESFKTLYSEIIRVNKEWQSSHVEALFAEAYSKKQITFNTYSLLERGRLVELQQSTLTMKAYLKKIQSLRIQYPLRDPNEKSDFISSRADKLKMSWRQRLVENYSDIQIVLMANIIKKLRSRLESPKAEILIFDRENGVETIELEPMERFRLAIKLLRKENSLLALNTYFSGRTPDYMDLMSAAYELGIIPASELQEVAGLEDIWNPKKTFWEKADLWVRTFSTVATLAIPPPYGFIPALAVVVIEMTVAKKDDQTQDNTVLF